MSGIVFITTDSTIENVGILYLIDASANNVTITFPAVTNGTGYSLGRMDSNIGNTVKIIGQPGEMVNGYPSKLLNPHTGAFFSKFYGNWYTSSTNVVGNEFYIPFSQLVGTNATNPYITVTNEYFTSVAVFTYNGRAYYSGDPIMFEITYSTNSNTSETISFELHLQDLINKTIIGTIGPITQTGTKVTYFTTYITTFSNIPEESTQIEIDAKLTSSGTSGLRLYSARMILN